MSQAIHRKIETQAFFAGLLYFVVAVATIMLTSNGHEVTTVWPANAVLVALMLQTPRARWRPILVAGFVANIAANLATRSSFIGPVLFGLSNLAEVCIVAWALSPSFTAETVLRRQKSLGLFLLWAGLIGPACSSVLGAATAALAFDQPFLAAMETWFFSDALGLLIFTPFFFSLFSGEYFRCFRVNTASRKFEGIALQGLVLLTAIAVFSTDHLPVLFLIAIPVMLVTFRLGWLGTKVSVMIVGVVVAAATAKGTGPIMLADMEHWPRGLFSQFYLASLLLMQMPVAAALKSLALTMERLVQAEKSVRVLAEQSDILLLSLNRSGQFVRVIGAARKMIGKDEKELLGRSFEVLTPEIGERLSSGFREIMDYDCFDQALEFPAPFNRQHWREARFRVLEADDLDNFEVALTVQDITDRKRRESELVTQAHVDGMTGLLNRAGFTDAAQRRIAQANDGEIFLVMIDVDRFKLINDNLGHAAGDAVLAAIARQMKSHLRSTDIIGRLGGDEFAIILTGVSSDQAYEACNRLVASVGRTPVPMPDGKQVDVNISCGMACWHTGMDLERFKHNADMALYEAKRGGRNQAVAA